MPEDLSREFKLTAQAIWNWVRPADRKENRKPDGATSAERKELSCLINHGTQSVQFKTSRNMGVAFA